MTEVQRSFDPSILERQVTAAADIQAGEVTGSIQPCPGIGHTSVAIERPSGPPLGCLPSGPVQRSRSTEGLVFTTSRDCTGVVRGLS